MIKPVLALLLWGHGNLLNKGGVSIQANDGLLKVRFAECSPNNNLLTDKHIEQIIKVFDSKEDIAHLAKTESFEAIADNDYNLSVSSYVEARDTREKVDIVQLNSELKTTVERIAQLRSDIDAIVAEIEA